MSESPNKLIRFWQEIKRRKTGKVIVAYAATAFVILQLVDILAPSWMLPDWTTRLVSLILIIGFPVAIIFSWVFDITPEGIKKTESSEESENKESVRKPVKKILSTSNIINAILIIAVAVLAYPKIFKRDTLEKLRSSGERISVAVMPFQNLTNDTQKNFWQEMIQDNLITSLSNTEELTIRQPESIMRLLQNNEITNYASITPSIASNLSQKLDANIFVHGSINQIGTVIRLNAKLIDSETEEVFKSFQINGTEDNILNIADSLSVMIKNFLILSKLIKEAPLHLQKYISTDISPQAYKVYTEGKNAFEKYDYPTAINMFLQAIAIDSNFVTPLLNITWAYSNQGLYEEAKKWCIKVDEKKNLMSRVDKMDADVLHSFLFETLYETVRYLKQEMEFDDQIPMVHYDLGVGYNDLHQYDKSIPEFKKALEIYSHWGVKPDWDAPYSGLGMAYYKTGQYKKEKKVYKNALQDFPESTFIAYGQAIMALTESDTIAANKYIKKYITLLKERSLPETTITTNLASIYSEANILDKAEEYYRQALSLEPDSTERMNNLAYFLIDKGRNITKGMGLVDTLLKSSPGDYNFMHTKGWGLYKQGKYQEAMEILQKSWDLRMKKSIYDHEAFLHLDSAKKAVVGMNNY